MQESEEASGKMGVRGLLGKAAGDKCVFIPGEDEVGSDAIPDVAGGEGGHGVAKPDRVIKSLGL